MSDKVMFEPIEWELILKAVRLLQERTREIRQSRNLDERQFKYVRQREDRLGRIEYKVVSLYGVSRKHVECSYVPDITITD